MADNSLDWQIHNTRACNAYEEYENPREKKSIHIHTVTVARIIVRILNLKFRARRNGSDAVYVEAAMSTCCTRFSFTFVYYFS